jgi:hypothetical protein
MGTGQLLAVPSLSPYSGTAIDLSLLIFLLGCHFERSYHDVTLTLIVLANAQVTKGQKGVTPESSTISALRPISF